ncbi:MAG: endonuclease MutS2 [Defluviitaleaceae bacterium]|nr:endonuclease MutS2 [Defluviitaleaceae bacterium]
MDNKSLKSLEYHKIIQKLTDKAISQKGKALCDALLPVDNLEIIQKTQQETHQALQMVLKQGTIPLGGIKDITPSLKRAGVGGILNIEELFHIGEFIYVCKKIKSYAAAVDSRDYLDLIDPRFEEIEIPVDLEKSILRCIKSEQEIADDATQNLSAIRRGIKTSNARINETLSSLIQSTSYKNMLQDTVITMRNGRFCVPVKQEHKSNFPGMVHDVSGSGATMFIEPMAVVSLNNKIKELEAEEKEEIERILTALTLQVSDNAQALSINEETLTYLDFIFAKAALALEMQATQPHFNNDGMINIYQGRHPLLNQENVVPTDIYLGQSFDALLITGPNTGGKTVALKVLGLFTLMGMSGLFIPAASGSMLSTFDSVFADIGDEQSIEQSLSTFSAHMTNIVRILNICTPRSLVLFDELGAGTDPTEGASLAIAIIKNLLAKGIKSTITTHYAELKLFALATDRVENGAVEFDVQTLSPTYRLMIGVPGKSNAFSIATRLGLSGDIVQEAKDALSGENIRFEDVITDLEIAKRAAKDDEERVHALRQEVEKIARDLDAQKQKMLQSKEKALKVARDEAKGILRKAKEEADAIIKEMHKIHQAGETFAKAEAQRKKLRDATQALDVDNTQEEVKKAPLKPVDRPLEAGDGVYIHSMGQRGIVSKADKRYATIKVGAMETRVKLSDLSLQDAPKQTKTEKHLINDNHKGFITRQKSANIATSISLRGLLVEECGELLSKYLDDAFLGNLGRVEIIHGKGSGTLRDFVHRFLKGHPHVKSYRLGAYGEGDSGITVVELK